MNGYMLPLENRLGILRHHMVLNQGLYFAYEPKRCRKATAVRIEPIR